MNESDIRLIRTRKEMIRFLDGYAYERKEELDERRLKGPLVKSHLLEILLIPPDFVVSGEGRKIM